VVDYGALTREYEQASGRHHMLEAIFRRLPTQQQHSMPS
jgi:hypothetical protein